MSGPLVIVESPAKAKTIAGFLDDDVVVKASIGHIYDLAVSRDLTDEQKKQPGAEYGVDIYNGFAPTYVLHEGKRSTVRELKQLLKQADALYLATDEDREGEAIAAHLLMALDPPAGMPVHRMVFHEITAEAIQEAINSPRELDHKLVDAQETRRILDRLYGWDISGRGPQGRSRTRARPAGCRASPCASSSSASASAWPSVPPTTGASRPSWPSREGDTRSLNATVVLLDGARIATGKDFDRLGRPVRPGVVVLDEAAARAPRRRGAGRRRDRASAWSASPTAAARRPRSPPRPSSRRPAASCATRRSGPCAPRRRSTSRASSPTCGPTRRRCRTPPCLRPGATSPSASGRTYVPDEPRVYKKKAKNAQEAHEAIRPAGETFRHPDEVAARGQRRAGRGLPPHLAAHHRLADDRRHRRDGHGALRRRPAIGRRRRVGRRRAAHQRHRHQPPGLPAGLRRGPSTRATRPRTTRSASSRPWPRATRSTCAASTRAATPPSRPPATPRRRW